MPAYLVTLRSASVTPPFYLQVVHNGFPCQPNELHACAGIAEAPSPHMNIASRCHSVHLEKQEASAVTLVNEPSIHYHAFLPQLLYMW